MDEGIQSRNDCYDTLPNLSEKRRTWLQRIRLAGERGVTLDELSEQTGQPPNAFSGRITELKKLGLVYHSADRRKTRSGKQASVIRATAKREQAMQLRDYQQDAVDATWRDLASGKGHPVIVAPTGAGKSIIIAEMARQAAEANRPVLVLAHRKELLTQNAEKIQALLPNVEVGIYSAGLKRRDKETPIVCCGIQSVFKRAFEFGERRLILVDEAHLIPPGRAGSSMYRQFLEDIATANPSFRMVGLTATPYRLDSGLIYGDDEPFDRISYQIQIKTLLDQGYISPIVSKTVEQIDTSRIRRVRGEFHHRDMAKVFDEYTIEAVEEMVAIADRENRQHCLIFSSGIEHARNICQTIEELTGSQVSMIAGDTLPLIRETIISKFRSGQIRFLVNCDVLTVGFDAPNIDLIAVMRATESPGLFMQICGRGFRLHDDKENCLLLDYGENLLRHGPLDSQSYGERRKSSGGETGDVPVKQCPSCEVFVAAGTRRCECGWEFPPPEVRHEANADQDSPVLLSDVKKLPEKVWTVKAISWTTHVKRGADEDHPRTMRVTYEVVSDDEEDAGDLSGTTISEWVCIEHPEDSFARRKAVEWWRKRSYEECPTDVDDATEIASWMGLADTEKIKTKQEGKYHRITGYKLGEIPTGYETKYAEDEVPF